MTKVWMCSGDCGCHARPLGFKAARVARALRVRLWRSLESQKARVAWVRASCCTSKPFVIRFAQSLAPQLSAIKARDPKLADQLRRALMAVGLNLGEGFGASGGNKRRAYRIALAEASELQMGLLMAEALRYCVLSAEQRDALGSILATLHKLARLSR